MGFLVGQTMRAMKGKADPGLVNQTVEGTAGKVKEIYTVECSRFTGEICQVIQVKICIVSSNHKSKF